MTATQRRLANIRTTARDATLRIWDDLPDYNKPRIAAFTAKAVPTVQTAQRNAAKVTASTLRRVQPVKITPALLDVRGVDPTEVYARPFGKVWKALGDGKPLDQAISDGRSYLAALAVMDIAMTVRATYQAADDAVPSWERIADPGACDLCVAAAGSIYAHANDMGLHPGCGCTLEPGAGSSPTDPTAVATHDSDELGALLYSADHSFAAV